jgi:nitrogen-specific signal transduction histidine kinase
MAITVVRDVSYARHLERELRESQKMELLGRMVGGVAHDFNNVLAAITLYCDLLATSLPGDGSSARYAREIRLAADQGCGIVRQLMSFARPHARELRHVSIHAVLDGARDLLQRVLGDDIKVVMNRAETVPAVLADPAQLQEIILNLAMNSRDAMRDGGTITLSTAVKSLARATRRFPGLHRGEYVTLTVSDTGCGMDEATRHRIFEPFFTTKATGKGTGLGMSTVYRIVREAGGTVVVDSESGRGTRVTILLPACAGATLADHGDSEEMKLDGRQSTVLLVEDNAAVRHALTEMLSASGYQVLAAKSSPEATRLARRCPGSISLVITDIVMPGGCGCEVAREVVRKHPGARVLFVSGYPDGKSPATAAAVLLHKPFSRQQLARRIREVLSLPQQHTDALLDLACHGKEAS